MLRILRTLKRSIVIVKTFYQTNVLSDYYYNYSGQKNVELDYTEVGMKLRQACEQLGPIFIKLGQMLSTRSDLLPVELTNELCKLQDSVAPFSTEEFKNILKQGFGAAYQNIFTDLSEKPLASASVAQVHTARVEDKEVVIKVLRPDLKNIINQDLRVLKLLIKLILCIYPKFKKVKPYEQITELTRVLHDEQDLMREAANASQIRRNSSNASYNNNLVYVPQIYWQYCRKNILVLERIRGLSINTIANYNLNNPHKVNLELLAKRIIEVFFTQVFEDCIFHGDLHPGNIFINIDSPSSPSNPSFYAIDFGIIGTMGPEEQYYLSRNFWAFLNRDYRKVALLHIDSGWVPTDTRVDVFESAIRTVCEPILAQPSAKISFGELFVGLFSIAKQFNIQLQPQLLVFKKALINVEGLSRQLDPDIDLWTTTRPYIEKWMQTQVGFCGVASKISNNVPIWLGHLIECPELIYKLLKKNSNSRERNTE